MISVGHEPSGLELLARAFGSNMTSPGLHNPSRLKLILQRLELELEPYSELQMYVLYNQCLCCI
jgi:hypothetical protein